MGYAMSIIADGNGIKRYLTMFQLDIYASGIGVEAIPDQLCNCRYRFCARELS